MDYKDFNSESWEKVSEEQVAPGANNVIQEIESSGKVLEDKELDGIAGGMRTGGYDDPKWRSECSVCGKSIQVSELARHYEMCHKKR